MDSNSRRYDLQKANFSAFKRETKIRSRGQRISRSQPQITAREASGKKRNGRKESDAGL